MHGIKESLGMGEIPRTAGRGGKVMKKKDWKAEGATKEELSVH